MSDEKMPGRWERLTKWGAGCAVIGEAEDVKAAIKHARQILGVASNMDRVGRVAPKVMEHLRQATEGLEKIDEGLEKVDNFCKDFIAMWRIHAAIKVLNDPGVMYEDSNRAAEAFGELFAGAGRLARYLPAPANQYADILAGCSQFFVKMRGLIVPELRPGTQGDILRKINRGTGSYGDLR